MSSQPQPQPQSSRHQVPTPLPAAVGTVPLARTLPQPLAPFVGRDADLARISELLANDEVRLLTMTGPGGVGKTRLALQAATAIAATFPGAIHFVPLASVSNPQMVAATISQVVGAGDGGARPAIDSLVVALRERRTLLILDSMEHLLPTRSLVSQLLASCPKLRIVATSRVPLRIYGERRYRVAPLDVPTLASGYEGEDADGIAMSDAVRLFLTRASAVDPDVAVTRDTISTVAKICRRLDGLPLAIELAAARAGEWPMEWILDRLDQRLSLLIYGPLDAPVRHQTVRKTIAWSYNLLGDVERSCFRSLAIFAGGITLDAATAVMGSGSHVPVVPVANGLAALAEASMLLRRHSASDQPRFQMLDTVHEYGLEQLAAHDGLAEIQRAHANYFLRRVQEIGQELAVGRRVAYQLDLLEQDLPDIRSAMDWSSQHDPAMLAAFVWALAQYWLRRSRLKEGREWLERSRASSPALSRRDRARTLAVLARIVMYLQDPSAPLLFEEARQLATEEHDDECTLVIRIGQTIDALIRDRVDLAAEYADDGLALSDTGRVQDDVAAPWTLRGLQALIAAAKGELESAERHAQFALAGAARDQDEHSPCMALRALGIVARKRQHAGQALEYFQAALLKYWSVGERWGVAICTLDNAALIASSQPREAVWLCGVAGKVLTLLGGAELDVAREPVATIHVGIAATMGEEAFQEAWRQGSESPEDEAIARVLSFDAAALQPVVQAHDTATSVGQILLTPRKREVLRLIVEGKSDREIAASLGIAYRTATTYVTALHTKLNVNSRTAAATFALRNRLA